MIQINKKTIFNIKNAIEKSFNIIKGSIKAHHIDVNINIEKELYCNSYLEELQQVILTILNNAIDALVSAKIDFKKINITASSNEDFLQIDIQDNANGIDEKVIDKIFEPYFTTKHKTQGTGLGLYMAKMIIDDGLKGSLSVKNKINGACFTIQIPQGDI